MANTTGAVRAGRAYVEIFADDSALARGLARAQARIRAFGAAIAGAGSGLMAMGAGLVKAAALIQVPASLGVKAFTSLGDEMMKASRRTGITVESLSELAYAADLSGSSLAGLERSIRIMQRTIGGFKDPLEGTTDSLAALGLRARDLANKTVLDKFLLLAEAISKLPSPSARAAAAMSLFGRAGTELLPLMAQGRRGIEALIHEARRLGLTIGGPDAAAAEEFKDTMETLWAVIKRLGFEVGAALTPALQATSRWLTQTAATARAWIGQNRALIAQIARIGTITLVAGGGLLTLGFALTKAGAIVSALATGLGVIKTGLLGITAVLGVLLTPLGAVVTAAAFLGAYLVHASTAGGRAIAWLAERFGDLKNDALRTWKAIGDAMAAGDLALAAKVLWTSLKLAWAEGSAQLLAVWLDLKSRILSVYWTLGDALRTTGQSIATALFEAWNWIGQSYWRLMVSTMSAYIRVAIQGASRLLQYAANAANALSGGRFATTGLAKAIAAADQLGKVYLSNLDAATQAELEASRKRQAAKAKEIEQIDAANRASIDEESARRRDAMQKDADARIKAAVDAAAAARAEWEKSLKDAAAAAAAIPSLSKPSRFEPPDVSIPTATLQRTIEVVGTFSAAAIGRMGYGPRLQAAMDRTANATTETARNTKRLLDEHAARGEFAFE
jgi:hypothetical protein